MFIINWFFPAKNRALVPVSLAKKIPGTILMDIILLLYFIEASWTRSIGRPDMLPFLVAVNLTSLSFPLSLFMVRRARYRGASLVASYACLLNIFWMGILVPAGGPQDLYRFTAYTIASVIANAMVSLSLRQIYVYATLTVAGFATYAAWAIAGRFGVDAETGVLLVMNATLVVTVNGIVMAITRMNQDLINLAEGEMEHNRKQLDELRSIIGNASASFEIGQQLTDAMAHTRRTSSAMAELLAQLRVAASHLADDARSADNANQDIVLHSQAMGQSVSAQTSTLDDTASAIHEITTTIQNIGQVADAKKTSVRNVARDLDDQSHMINKAREGMKRIQESSARALSLITVIEDVAEKTNMLAMNASIEAAHAGVQGRSFAVIAGEIRKLSEEARTGAQSISGALRENDSIVSESSHIIQGFTEQMDLVSQEVQNTLNAMEEILSSISEISTGTHDLTKATAKMATIARDSEMTVNGVNEKVRAGADSVSRISEFSTTLLSEVDGLNTGFSSIEKVLDRVQEIGDRNINQMAMLKLDLSRMEQAKR